MKPHKMSSDASLQKLELVRRLASDLTSSKLLEILDNGRLRILLPDGREILCDWLDTGSVPPELTEGDRLLVAELSRDEPSGVALGRIAPYRSSPPRRNLRLEASESLTLVCGEAKVDVQADGRIAIKGEDIVLRAKGTQRIRAGTVAIN